MLRWPHIAGIALGSILGALLLAILESPRSRHLEKGPILSECDGQIRELVIHYEPGAREVSLPVYRQFLPMLASNVLARVVCPDEAAYRELHSMVGPMRCRVEVLLVRHPITSWSRDRWVPLGGKGPGAPTTLWSPRGEAAEELWPARAGDQLVGAELAAAWRGSLSAGRSALYFDGGDFLADDQHVFVMPRILERNLQHTAASRELLLAMLQAELKLPVVFLESAPDHHAGMFMASIGHRTMLVGDPSLGKTFATAPRGASVAAATEGPLPGSADFSERTQSLFDAVARQCEAAGYRVVRIPTMVGSDGRTYFTYVNAVIDEQPSGRVVYMPIYKDQQRMNAAARAIWEAEGFEVRPIDCTSTYRHGGCLHCLVNVCRRDPVRALEHPPTSLASR